MDKKKVADLVDSIVNETDEGVKSFREALKEIDPTRLDLKEMHDKYQIALVDWSITIFCKINDQSGKKRSVQDLVKEGYTHKQISKAIGELKNGMMACFLVGYDLHKKSKEGKKGN